MAKRPAPGRIGIRFAEAIEALRRRLELGSEEWLEVLGEEDAAASSTAGDVLRSVTADLMAAVLEVMEAGGTIEDFRRDYARVVEEHGWTYKGDPGWHSQLIYRMHTGMAYAAGRWEQAQRLEAARPGHYFGRLLSVGDHRVRHNHALMHGIIRPISDSYWLTHWPPNGFNCRCYVQVVTATSMRRYGWRPTSTADPAMLIQPDSGWGRAVSGVAPHQ